MQNLDRGPPNQGPSRVTAIFSGDTGAKADMNIYKPMLPLPTPESFIDPEWVFEVKWGGLRTLAYITDEVSLQSRSAEELVQKFPELGELSELASDVVLDGEIIVMKNKIPDFDAVVRRSKANTD